MPCRGVGDLRSIQIGRPCLETFLKTVTENLAECIVKHTPADQLQILRKGFGFFETRRKVMSEQRGLTDAQYLPSQIRRKWFKRSSTACVADYRLCGADVLMKY